MQGEQLMCVREVGKHESTTPEKGRLRASTDFFKNRRVTNHEKMKARKHQLRGEYNLFVFSQIFHDVSKISHEIGPTVCSGRAVLPEEMRTRRFGEAVPLFFSRAIFENVKNVSFGSLFCDHVLGVQIIGDGSVIKFSELSSPTVSIRTFNQDIS